MERKMLTACGPPPQSNPRLTIYLFIHAVAPGDPRGERCVQDGDDVPLPGGGLAGLCGRGLGRQDCRGWRGRREACSEAAGEEVEVFRADGAVATEVAGGPGLARLPEVAGEEVEVGGADAAVAVGVAGQDEEGEWRRRWRKRIPGGVGHA